MSREKSLRELRREVVERKLPAESAAAARGPLRPMGNQPEGRDPYRRPDHRRPRRPKRSVW